MMDKGGSRLWGIPVQAEKAETEILCYRIQSIMVVMGESTGRSTVPVDGSVTGEYFLTRITPFG